LKEDYFIIFDWSIDCRFTSSKQYFWTEISCWQNSHSNKATTLILGWSLRYQNPGRHHELCDHFEISIFFHFLRCFSIIYHQLDLSCLKMSNTVCILLFPRYVYSSWAPKCTAGLFFSRSVLLTYLVFCVVFLLCLSSFCVLFPLLHVSLDYPLLIAPSVYCPLKFLSGSSCTPQQRNYEVGVIICDYPENVDRLIWFLVNILTITQMSVNKQYYSYFFIFIFDYRWETITAFESAVFKLISIYLISHEMLQTLCRVVFRSIVKLFSSSVFPSDWKIPSMSTLQKQGTRVRDPVIDRPFTFINVGKRFLKKWSSRPRSAFCSDYCSRRCVHNTTLWLGLSVPYCRSIFFVYLSYLRCLVLKCGFASSTLEKLKCASSTLDFYSNNLFICCLKIGGKYSIHILDENKVNNIIKLKGNEERMGQQW